MMARIRHLDDNNISILNTVFKLYKNSPIMWKFQEVEGALKQLKELHYNRTVEIIDGQALRASNMTSGMQPTEKLS